MNLTPLLNALQAGTDQPRGLLLAFVEGVANGSVDHETATTWLKAVHLHGCTRGDTVLLTEAMRASGAILTWPEGPPVVDKHSTGGVGDKMSLMLAPALAACGLRVPMLAGRGLGHTGGTIDKLEAIPGFNCQLTPVAMMEAVANVGCCIAVQNDAIAPTDGVLYALRDVTDTIDSLPLITASIVSKKAAEGLDALVLDVKVGEAAFMKTLDDARALAVSMVEAATGLGIKTEAQITDMNAPIGTHIGNALEVIESVEVMQGLGSVDTRELVVLQGTALLTMTTAIGAEEAEQRMRTVLNNGAALDVFQAMCVQQGVEPSVAAALVADPQSVLGHAPHQTTVLAKEAGHVALFQTMAMAQLARAHGAGRFHLDDTIDPLVGFVLHHTTGRHVAKGDAVLTFHHTRPLNDDEMANLVHFVNVGSPRSTPPTRLVERIQSSLTKP